MHVARGPKKRFGAVRLVMHVIELHLVRVRVYCTQNFVCLFVLGEQLHVCYGNL